MMEKYHTKINGVEIVLPYPQDLKVKQMRRITDDKTMLEEVFSLLPEEGSPEREAVEDLTVDEFMEFMDAWGNASKSASPKE